MCWPRARPACCPPATDARETAAASAKSALSGEVPRGHPRPAGERSGIGDLEQMKTFAFAALACATAVAAPVLAAPPAPADAVALRLLAVAADEAWNAKDAPAMAAHYAADASLRVGAADAPDHRGREAVRAYFARTFAARAQDLRHVTDLKGMTQLAPDLVMNDADVRVEARQPDGSWKLVRRFNNVSLAAREGGGWKLKAVRAYPIG